MNGELAQVMALASHGSVWLASPERPSGHVIDEHTVAAFAGAGSWDLLVTGKRNYEWWRQR